MKVIAITGTSSFIGQHLVQYLSSLQGIEMRLLVHSCQPHLPAGNKSLRFIQGDLLKPQTLSDFLTPDCLVIHLAYLHGASDEPTLKPRAIWLRPVLKPCEKTCYCSTAGGGKTSDNSVTEETKCEPGNSYEIPSINERLFTKEAWTILIGHSASHSCFEWGNPLKLADDLTMGSRILNYLKSACLITAV